MTSSQRIFVRRCWVNICTQYCTLGTVHFGMTYFCYGNVHERSDYWEFPKWCGVQIIPKSCKVSKQLKESDGSSLKIENLLLPVCSNPQVWNSRSFWILRYCFSHIIILRPDVIGCVSKRYSSQVGLRCPFVHADNLPIWLHLVTKSGIPHSPNQTLTWSISQYI